MMNRILIGTVVGAVISFLVGWLVFGVVLMNFIESNMVSYPGLMKMPPDMIQLFLSNIFWNLTMAFIFVKWAKVYNFKKGMIVSMMVCIPISISIDLQYMAFMNLYKDFTIVIVDALGTAVMAAIVGGCMGWIYGKMGELPE